MDVLSNEWWGEPLDTMMSRILVQELNQRLPGSTVYGDNGAISTPADATVEINLQRFDLTAMALCAGGAGRCEKAHVSSRGVTFTVRAGGRTTQALVAAMSKAMARSWPTRSRRCLQGIRALNGRTLECRLNCG